MPLVEAPPSVKDLANKVITMSKFVPSLHGREGSGEMKSLMKFLGVEGEVTQGYSFQSVALGIKEHPFDFEATTRFQTSNVHHSACIKTKTASTVGLGFKSPGEDTVTESLKNIEHISKVDEILNPLCEFSFQDVLSDSCEDGFQIGNGYIEVVRRGGSPRTTTGAGRTARTTGDEITGLHHAPGWQARVFVEDYQYHRHYQIMSWGEDANPRAFALFGDRKNFINRMKGSNKVPGFPRVDEETVSELIVLRQPSSLSRWYGFPSWLSAVASIELVQSLHQWKYDFFLNRGVPEYLLFILGKKLDPKVWEKLEESLKSHIGIGNSHKSSAINLEDDVQVELMKMGMEGKTEDQFGDIKDTLALDIVSAHQVPPLLAGIQIPGKLGSTNELPNALLAFQVLVIGPAQRWISQVLGQTLGNKELNGGLALSPEDFYFRRIIDTIDLNNADTISRMRTPAAAAAAQGRNISDGLKN